MTTSNELPVNLSDQTRDGIPLHEPVKFHWFTFKEKINNISRRKNPLRQILRNWPIVFLVGTSEWFESSDIIQSLAVEK